MLLLNHYARQLPTSTNISIHLMLLLNRTSWSYETKAFDFNTSYVVIKQKRSKKRVYEALISIHLMLLLNNKDVPILYTGSEFQYILCCY